MPQKTETISAAGYDESTLMFLAYGTLRSLDWTIKYIVDKQIIAYTPRSWNKYDHEINVEIAGGQLTVTSKHIHGEIADLPGRNKKFIAEFIAAFESVKTTATEEQLNTWKEKVSSTQEETITIAKEEIQKSEEVDKVMNLSQSKLYVTYAIMVINIIVFIMMTVSGVNLFAPTGLDIINWGGNFSPLTLSGDSWRLITCVFVHIGIIHILFNMYALFMIGIYLEPMLGKARFIGAYLATGICASVASLWWHDEPIASAGASGAIFGMYGVFLALLSTNLVPKHIRDTLLKSIAIFIGYNLIYGMKSGIDNAAHFGGLLSGLIIGYIYYFGWNGKNAQTRKFLLSLAVFTGAIIGAYMFIQNNKQPLPFYPTIEIVEKPTFQDEQADEIYARYKEREDRATDLWLETGLTDAEIAKKIEENMIPELQKAKKELIEIKTTGSSEKQKQIILMLLQLCNLRIEEAALFKRRAIEGNSVDILNELDQRRQQIEKLNDKLESLQ